VVGKTPPAVDLDDRDPLPVRGLERLVAADVDLAELEFELPAERPYLRQRPLAQVAPSGVVDDNLRDISPA
jgi:hypothetical protein